MKLINTVRNILKEFINENIDFLLDKESQEYWGIIDDYGDINSDKVHSDTLKYCKDAIDLFKEHVDIYDTIKIVFNDNIGKGNLGMFRSQTGISEPIILLSEKNMMNASVEYDVPLWVVVETTILHELGHAICELEYEMFGYEYLEYGNEEEWVEEFAYQLHTFNRIPQDLKELILAIKKLS